MHAALGIFLVYHEGHTPPAIASARIDCAYSSLSVSYVAI